MKLECVHGARYFTNVVPPWGPMNFAPVAASSRVDRGCTPVKNYLILAVSQVDLSVDAPLFTVGNVTQKTFTKLFDIVNLFIQNYKLSIGLK